MIAAFIGAMLGLLLAVGLICGVHPRFRRGPIPSRYWTKRK